MKISWKKVFYRKKNVSHRKLEISRRRIRRHLKNFTKKNWFSVEKKTREQSRNRQTDKLLVFVLNCDSDTRRFVLFLWAGLLCWCFLYCWRWKITFFDWNFFLHFSFFFVCFLFLLFGLRNTTQLKDECESRTKLSNGLPLCGGLEFRRQRSHAFRKILYCWTSFIDPGMSGTNHTSLSGIRLC